MGRKHSKKRQAARKNTNKQKKTSAKKTPVPLKEETHDEANVQTEATPVVGENAAKERRWRVVGLANLRNTCYFNSVLQLLLSSPSLQESFSQTAMRAVVSASSLTAALCELFDAASAPTDGAPVDKADGPPTLRLGQKKIHAKPSRALGALRTLEPTFKSRGQHDAHELLMALLSHLVEEAENFKETGPNWMEESFGGKLLSKITCKKCGHIKSREESFLVLSISVVRETGHEGQVAASDGPMEGDAVVVEKENPGALAHLRPGGDQSSLQNNFLDDSASEAQQNDADSGDDMWSALHDLFTDPDEEQHFSDSAASLCEKDQIETANNEVFGKGRRKGKHKGKKKTDRFEGFDFDEEQSVEEIDARKFQSVTECLRHFFEEESVTWRCAGEYPEKRVSFSEQPEVFLLPSRLQGSISFEKEEIPPETGQSSDGADVLSLQRETELKSCLKKAHEPLPPIPVLNSTKQYSVWKAPKVLCIHLKRFEAVNHRRLNKLGHAVRFDIRMHLEEFLDPSTPTEKFTEYELKAVVCHSGSLSFGHYTAYVSRTLNGAQQWYDVSDNDVRKSSLMEVLKAQAYILLYEAASSDTVSCP